MDVAVGVLTAALVLVTLYYAYQTRETVKELRAARAAGIMPKPVVDFDYIGGPIFHLALANAGTGPALDVDLTMRFEPQGSEIRWEGPLLSAGERIHFWGPEDTHLMTELVEKYERLVLTGSCLDALGSRCDVHQTLILREHWQAAVESKRLLEESDLVKMTGEIQKISREIESVRRTLERRK